MQDPLYETSQEKVHSGPNTKERYTSLEQLCYLLGFCAFLQTVCPGWILHQWFYQGCPTGTACPDPQIPEDTSQGKPTQTQTFKKPDLNPKADSWI